MNDQKAQQLIAAFFKALESMELAQCQEQLRTLDEVAKRMPVYRDWHTYLTGILTYKLDHDWPKSEAIFRTLLKKKLDLSLRGRVLIALGIVCRYQGHFDEALATYRQCLTVFDRPDQAIDRAKVWKNIAIVLEVGFSQGEFGDEALDQAIEYCQLALDVLQSLENLGEAELWLEATTWNTLGLIYRSAGNWSQATHCFERLIAAAQVLDNSYWSVGAANHNLGEVLYIQGADKWPQARQAYLTALEIYRAPEFNDKYQEVDVLANLALLHHRMGDLTTSLDYYQQAIDLIERIRVSVTAEAGRAGYFTTVADTYAQAILLCLEMNQFEPAFNLVEQTCSRAFLDVLVAGSFDLPREREARPISLSDVQAALPDDALLLEYFTSGLLEAQEGQTNPNVQRHRFPPAKTLLFAVTRDALQIHEAGLSPNDLRPDTFDSVVERHFLQAPIRRSLYDRLIAPVESLLAGKQRLYLVPHGPLHYIPFHTLLAPDGDTLLRENGPQLIYGPSATLLFRYGRVTPKRAPQPCLTIGYNSQGLSQLHFAEDEARRVAHLSSGYTLSGSAPKKERLYAEAHRYRLLHFACHGEFDPERPLASFLEVAPGERLTAQEVLEQMPLQCDLVTLSACESGLSRVRRGDELIGFSRAFMHAGAPALISTLWRVNDHPTRILMERFYREVAAGLDFAEALKRAQLYVKNLTYREALDLLTAFQESPLDAASPPKLALDALPDRPRLALTRPQAVAYLRGAASGGQSDRAGTLPPEPEPDEKVFADPFYWAAFILIGDHRF